MSAAPHPRARRAAGAAVWHGDLVIHGGFGLNGRVTPDAVAGDLWCWQDGWNLLAADGPPPARYASLCVMDDGLYRFGGCGFDGGRPSFLNDLWRFDGRWRGIPAHGPRPSGRYTSALARRGTELIMFGGHSQAADGGKTYYGDLWRFDRSCWKRLHDADIGPGRRYGFGWCADGEALHLFGGFDGAANLADFWRLDLKTLRWTRLPEGPPARFCPALGAVNGAMVLFGGRSKTDPKDNLADTWMFDRTWRRLPDTISPGYHAKPAYASNGTEFWLFGGEGPHGHVSDLWRFTSRGWSELLPSRSDDPQLW